MKNGRNQHSIVQKTGTDNEARKERYLTYLTYRSFGFVPILAPHFWQPKLLQLQTRTSPQ